MAIAKETRTLDRTAGRASRRCASVMILVLALLGILFVAGIALLATVDFEADAVASLNRQRRTEQGISSVIDEASRVLSGSFMAGANQPFGDGSLGQNVFDTQLSANVFIPADSFYAEMPDVSPVVSQVEPYYDPNFPAGGGVLGAWIYSSFTDLRTMLKGVVPGQPGHAGWNWDDPTGMNSIVAGDPQLRGFINTALFGQVGDDAAVDADGDGIPDSRQVKISDSALFLPSQLDPIRRSLNPPDLANGEVYLSARIVPHGAMVNLNSAHPAMWATVLNQQAVVNFEPPYNPLISESILRRRGGVLSPRIFPPTKMFGNPFDASDPDVPGGGDLAAQLLPSSDSVLDGAYRRFWPFDPVDEHEIWLSLAVPDAPQQYDRRHLVTTLSFTDNLARPVRVPMIKRASSRPGEGYIDIDNPNDSNNPFGELASGALEIVNEEIRRAMFEANKRSWDPDIVELSFEYSNYPHDLPNPGICGLEGIDHAECRLESLNARKARLKLSLPWLDAALSDELITVRQRNRLVHDVFLMLLANAQGAEWREQTSNCGDDETLGTGVGFDANGNLIGNAPQCNDNSLTVPTSPYGEVSHREAQHDRTAAALAANMIDFADADDLPSRIEVRSMNPESFFDLSQAGLAQAGFDGIQSFVYGLERQAYITEVTVVTQEGGSSYVDEPVAWAVELYNPYAVSLQTDQPNSTYKIIEVNDDGSLNEIPLIGLLTAQKYIVFYAELIDGALTDSENWPDPPITNTHEVRELGDASGTSPFEFTNGSTLYLVREVQYPVVGGTEIVQIVVDQFSVDDPYMGAVDFGNDEDFGDLAWGDHVQGSDLYTVSMQRVGTQAAPWTFPVPYTTAIPGHEQGSDNSVTNPEVRPVEVNFADTGEFSTSFPTTGTMLLLMRHGNRPFADYINYNVADLAFTTHLDRNVRAITFTGGVPNQTTAPAYTQIDNGRMPVFDEMSQVDGMAVSMFPHHDGPVEFDLTTGQPADTTRVPSGSEFLPWGQLVFDYFTALPLSNPGPHDNPTADADFIPAQSAKPRVDLEGLRVHGQLDLNVAPWRVLAGLPLIPMEQVPAAFRDKIRLFTGVTVGDDVAASLGDGLAQSIVAYRELREFADAGLGVTLTGNYMVDGAGRGWMAGNPAYRRGTGFLSVGELANVRHKQAFVDVNNQPVPGYSNYSYFAFDVGMNATTNSLEQDYVNAVSLLVALNDWTTVRSHVFTMYAAFRGDPTDDESVSPIDAARGVEERAIRFQETVNRLPLLLGEQHPLRVGQRTITGHLDALND